MARLFAAGGHNLALAARRIDRLESAREELTAEHPGVAVSAHELDVTDDGQVADVMRDAVSEHGGLDRVIVNAGLGSGGRIGSGRAAANRETMQTNVLGALSQCEAAMEHFYERGSGHLVLIASMAAVRGMPGSMNAYAASKAALAHVGEGIRADLLGRHGHNIAVTTVFPGYIATEMNARAEGNQPLMTDSESGSRAMVKAIDKEVATANVPGWPWTPIGQVLKRAPLGVVRRMV